MPKTYCDKTLLLGSGVLFIQYIAYTVVNLLIFCEAARSNWKPKAVYDFIMPIMRGVTLPLFAGFYIILFFFTEPHVDSSWPHCDLHQAEMTRGYIIFNGVGLGILIYILHIIRLGYYIKD